MLIEFFIPKEADGFLPEKPSASEKGQLNKQRKHNMSIVDLYYTAATVYYISLTIKLWLEYTPNMLSSIIWLYITTIFAM